MHFFHCFIQGCRIVQDCIFLFRETVAVYCENHTEHTNTSQVKIKVTLQLTVSQSVSFGVEPHLGLMTRYLLLFDSYGFVFVGRPLTRGRVCLLHMLRTLASAVFLGSEPLGTHDHILLSHI
jgi:hypothetical protein